MSNYYLILLWIGITYLLTNAIPVQKIGYVCGKRVRRYSFIWAFLIFLPVILWSGYRGNVGDTYTYTRMFGKLPNSVNEIAQYMDQITKDKGFYFCSALIKCLITDNVNIYFIIIAIVHAIPLILIYRRYSTNYIVSFFLFIASTDYISWMFNGIRQFVAVAITFACFGCILKKKYVPAIIIILFAAIFHGSALLMLPFIFIAQGKAWNKKTIMFILAVIVAVSFVDRFTNILETLLVETQYENVVSDWKNWNDDGTNVLRVLVYSVPAIISFMGYRFIGRVNDPIINLCTNMSIISAGFYIISMFTSGIFIGRLPIYFSL